VLPASESPPAGALGLLAAEAVFVPMAPAQLETQIEMAAFASFLCCVSLASFASFASFACCPSFAPFASFVPLPSSHPSLALLHFASFACVASFVSFACFASIVWMFFLRIVRS